VYPFYFLVLTQLPPTGSLDIPYYHPQVVTEELTKPDKAEKNSYVNQ